MPFSNNWYFCFFFFSQEISKDLRWKFSGFAVKIFSVSRSVLESNFRRSEREGNSEMCVTSNGSVLCETAIIKSDGIKSTETNNQSSNQRNAINSNGSQMTPIDCFSRLVPLRRFGGRYRSFDCVLPALVNYCCLLLLLVVLLVPTTDAAISSRGK